MIPRNIENALRTARKLLGKAMAEDASEEARFDKEVEALQKDINSIIPQWWGVGELHSGVKECLDKKFKEPGKVNAHVDVRAMNQTPWSTIVPVTTPVKSIAEFIWEANDLFAKDNISVDVGMWVTEDAINFRVTVKPL
jgi:hypothetical protein